MRVPFKLAVSRAQSCFPGHEGLLSLSHFYLKGIAVFLLEVRLNRRHGVSRLGHNSLYVGLGVSHRFQPLLV